MILRHTWLLRLKHASQGQQSVSLHQGAAHSAMPWQPHPLRLLKLHSVLDLHHNFTSRVSVISCWAACSFQEGS